MADVGLPTPCAEYHEDIFRHAVASEMTLNIDPAYLDNVQGDQIPRSMREEIVGWLMELRDAYGFAGETIAHAIVCFDRFMSVTATPAQNVQMSSVACVALAVKALEKQPPSMPTLCNEAINSFTTSQLKAMEVTVYKQLGWRLPVVTPYTFLGVLMSGLLPPESSTVLRQYSEMYIDMCMLDYGMLAFTSSTVCAASLMAAYELHARTEVARTLPFDILQARESVESKLESTLQAIIVNSFGLLDEGQVMECFAELHSLAMEQRSPGAILKENQEPTPQELAEMQGVLGCDEDLPSTLPSEAQDTRQKTDLSPSDIASAEDQGLFSTGLSANLDSQRPSTAPAILSSSGPPAPVPPSPGLCLGLQSLQVVGFGELLPFGEFGGEMALGLSATAEDPSEAKAASANSCGAPRASFVPITPSVGSVPSRPGLLIAESPRIGGGGDSGFELGGAVPLGLLLQEERGAEAAYNYGTPDGAGYGLMESLRADWAARPLSEIWGDASASDSLGARMGVPPPSAPGEKEGKPKRIRRTSSSTTRISTRAKEGEEELATRSATPTKMRRSMSQGSIPTQMAWSDSEDD